MSLQKARLTLDPSGTNETIFEAEGSIAIEPTGEYNFLLDDAVPQLRAAATKLFDVTSQANSPMAVPFLNVGAGRRRFEVSFDKWTGESNQWGGITSEITDPTATEKLAYLEDELSTRRPDSLNPAEFEYSIFSSGGIRDPIPVVPIQYNPTVDYAETSSTSRIRLTLVEALDLSQTIDDVTGNMNDSLLAFSFNPAGETGPKLPVPLDTFVTQRLDQAQEVVATSLEDPGGSSSPQQPQVAFSGLGAQDFRIEGVWRGANAQSLAETFTTDFANDAGTQEIDLVAKQASSTFAGTYTLADSPGTRVEPMDPRGGDNLWRFRMDLLGGA